MIELDKHSWSADLVPLTKNAWADLQRELAASGRWIMDGDLGPYDVRCPRLHRADTVVTSTCLLLAVPGAPVFDRASELSSGGGC